MSNTEIQKEIILLLKENKVPIPDSIQLLSQILQGFAHILYKEASKDIEIKIISNFN